MCICILISVAFGDDWDTATPALSVVEVTLGSTILLPCNPPSANPTPNVVWKRNGVVLNTPRADTSKYKVLSVSGDLIIANVNDDDIDDAGDNLYTYQCRVTNRLIYENIDSPFTYQLNRVG